MWPLSSRALGARRPANRVLRRQSGLVRPLYNATRLYRSCSPVPENNETHNLGEFIESAAGETHRRSSMAKQPRKMTETTSAINPVEKTAVAPGSGAGLIDRNTVAARAYQLWVERGCPEGSPEQDWYQAEQELGTGRKSIRAEGASSGSETRKVIKAGA